MNKEKNLADIELELFLEALFQAYGYDFRRYSHAHLRRRLEHRLTLSNLHSFSQLQHSMLHEQGFINLILHDLSINVTEMYRDTDFYLIVRQEVIPILKTYPFIKIWHAGCSSGEEVYSLAIILKEEKLYNRAQIYATDFNEAILKKAKDAVYPAKNIKLYTQNYQKAGGISSFSDYYTAHEGMAQIDVGLKKNIVFANHNLVTDSAFGEMQIIFCRNVLIYFERDLQDRVLKLFWDSLAPKGYLCLGTKETIRFSRYLDYFEIVDEYYKIYRKKS